MIEWTEEFDKTKKTCNFAVLFPFGFLYNGLRKIRRGGVIINNIMVPISEINARAMFQVTEEQMAMFEKGVSKIRITTIPIAHERTFDNDRIGERIYKYYKGVKSKNKDF